MFTAEHYRAIAEIFASHNVNPDHCSACSTKRTTLELMALDFADMFERDNPRFKRDQFYTAAGFARTMV
jgi:hypothetical protein